MRRASNTISLASDHALAFRVTGPYAFSACKFFFLIEYATLIYQMASAVGLYIGQRQCRQAGAS
jgi:hypothetical protein